MAVASRRARALRSALLKGEYTFTHARTCGHSTGGLRKSLHAGLCPHTWLRRLVSDVRQELAAGNSLHGHVIFDDAAAVSQLEKQVHPNGGQSTSNPSLEHTRQQLRKLDVLQRRGAIRTLSSLGAAAAPLIQDIAAALSDKDYVVRQEAAKTLAQLKELALPHMDELLQLRHDPKPEVVLAATDAVSKLAAVSTNYTQAQPDEHIRNGAAQSLLPLLRHEDSAVRTRSIGALCETRTQRADCLSALLEQLASDDIAVRVAALGAVGKLRLHTAELKSAEHVSNCDQCDEGPVATVGEVYVEPGRSESANMARSQTIAAACDQRAMSSHATETSAFDSLLPSLPPDSPLHLSAVLQAYGISIDRDASALLLLRMLDELPMAAPVLHGYGSLLEHLARAHAREAVRISAVRALGRLCDSEQSCSLTKHARERYVSTLVASLRDDQELDVRSAASASLSSSDTAALLPLSAMSSLAHHPCGIARCAAVRALVQAHAHELPRHSATVCAALSDVDDTVRLWAAAAAVELFVRSGLSVEAQAQLRQQLLHRVSEPESPCSLDTQVEARVYERVYASRLARPPIPSEARYEPERADGTHGDSPPHAQSPSVDGQSSHPHAQGSLQHVPSSLPPAQPLPPYCQYWPAHTHIPPTGTHGGARSFGTSPSAAVFDPAGRGPTAAPWAAHALLLTSGRSFTARTLQQLIDHNDSRVRCRALYIAASMSMGAYYRPSQLLRALADNKARVRSAAVGAAIQLVSTPEHVSYDGAKLATKLVTHGLWWSGDHGPEIEQVLVYAPTEQLMRLKFELAKVVAAEELTPDRRACAARLIGTLGKRAREQAPVLASSVATDRDPEVRRVAFAALLKVDASRRHVHVAVGAALGDTTSHLRLTAAKYASSLPPTEASQHVSRLVPLLYKRETSWSVRKAAAAALSAVIDSIDLDAAARVRRVLGRRRRKSDAEHKLLRLVESRAPQEQPACSFSALSREGSVGTRLLQAVRDIRLRSEGEPFVADLTRHVHTAPRPSCPETGKPLPRHSWPGTAEPSDEPDPAIRSGHRFEWNVKKI